MQDVLILSAARTAIGRFGGTLKDVSASDLGAIVVKEVLNKSGIQADQVDEVIMGNVLQAGQGQNPARQTAIKAGLPVEVPAFTVNMVCGSGLKSVEIAFDKIRLGESNIVIAGGMENMSQAVFAIKNMRWGQKMGNVVIEDLLLTDGLVDAFYGYHMGVTAENIAQKYNISREEQDIYAFRSQEKAKKAIIGGKFKDEIVPVHIKDKKNGMTIFDTDEFPRFDTTLEALSKLRPSFIENGTVTAGNSSGINDGAAALILGSEKKAVELSIEPMAIIKGIASVGVDPQYMGLGPVKAINKLLSYTGIRLEDIDLVEINEAFAAQAIACIKELGLDINKVNVNGGAIALGHPIGASASRILVTLLYEIKRRKAKYGVAAVCVGGGMGIAILIENLSLDS